MAVLKLPQLTINVFFFQVRTISRPHNNRTVDVRFYMAENNNNIPADDAVNTFNNLETKQLAGILGYSVSIV